MSLVGKSSPWGKIQTEREIMPGFTHVTTAGHGGVKLDRCLNSKIPNHMHTEGGWYEEDCQWSIPYVVLKDTLLRSVPVEQYETILSTIEAANSTMKNWYWQEYEQHFSLILKPGESSRKDDDMWKEANRGEYQVLSAFGDWHESVPNGHVGLLCGLGGRGNLHGMRRWFMVPATAYTGGHFLPEYSYHRVISPLQ